MKSLTHDQHRVIAALQVALESATEYGVLDLLLDFTKNPGSINDVCDALNQMETSYITTIAEFAEACRERNNQQIDKLYYATDVVVKESILGLASKYDDNPAASAFRLIGKAYNIPQMM